MRPVRTVPGKRKRIATFLAWGALLLGLAAASLAFSYRADNRFFRELSQTILLDAAAEDRRDVCLALLDFSSGIAPVTTPPDRDIPVWAGLYYRFFPFKPDPRTVLRYGTDSRGPCGSRSRVLAALLESQEIPVRLTALHGPQREALHTVVEADCGDGWSVLDPTYNLSFPDEQQRLLSAEQVRGREDVFQRATKGARGTAVPYHSSYPREEYNYRDVYPFNWEAVPGVLPAIRSLLALGFPEKDLDRLVAWPPSYRRPKRFLAEILAGLALLCLTAWGFARRRP